MAGVRFSFDCPLYIALEYSQREGLLRADEPYPQNKRKKIKYQLCGSMRFHYCMRVSYPTDGSIDT